MKKLYIFFLALFCLQFNQTQGKNTLNQERILESVSLFPVKNLNSKQVKTDMDLLHQLNQSRQFILQRDNVKSLAEGLRELNMQERAILMKYNNKIKPVNPGKQYLNNIRTENKRILTDENISSETEMMKAPEVGYSKQGMDSLVHYVWDNNLWKRKTKNSYKYNTSELMISSAGYEMGTTGWTQNERGTFEYNKYGKFTLNMKESLSDYATIWLIDYKESNTYDTNYRLIKTEITGQYYDPSVSKTETYGLERIDYAYNTAGDLNKITYYEWDDANYTWQNSVKIEMTVVNGEQTMFANYQWDNTYNSWVGTYKFEHALVSGTTLVNSTYYGWNTSVDNWFISSKEVLTTGTDANGANITQIVSVANPATYNLVQSVKNVYTKPFKNNLLAFDNFKLTEGFKWDNTSKTWINSFKTSNDFDTKGLISQTLIQKWFQDPATSAYNWTDSVRYLYTYDTQGNRATEIQQEKDVASSGWNNLTLTEFMYDITAENTGFIAYKNDGTGNWKFVSQTEHDEDQTGKLLKDKYIYFNEMFQRKIINNWDQYDYDASGLLTKQIYAKSAIMQDGQTQLFSVLTWGNQESYSYNASGKVTNETDYLYDQNKEDFVLSKKTDYQYHATYPTAVIGEYAFDWNTNTLQWDNKSKTEFTYNFTYPYSGLVLPSNIKNDTDGMLKYYAYLLQNSVTSVWNSTTKAWVNDEKNMMYFTTKTVSGMEQSATTKLKLYPNPVRDFVTIGGLSSSAIFKVFDLQGRMVLETEITGNEKADLTGLQAGVYLYEIRSVEGDAEKGKIIRE